MFAWEEYVACPFVTMHPARLRHKDIVETLHKLRDLRPAALQLQVIGNSYEGRAIYSATMGSGPTRVLAWSQMHGNEPTHTAVLLDLIDLLQRDPQKQICQDILNECTLLMVPMLNPDGAERYIRRTAQDIDMNRDALHLATPEGRLLRQLLEEFKPQFAFNLHNQQAGTSVDGKKVAAVSLLVPPIDEPDTQTEWTQQAKQVAGIFRNAVEPHCKGMISRYDADYMPRCFGEWVQQQKVSTITLEAGGWSSVDTGPLVQLHFVGFINALEAIANACYSSVEVSDYDSLPRSSDQYLLDVIVRDAKVVPGQGHEHYVADLGINFTVQEDRVPVERGGRIDDFGDLCVTSGKTEYAAEDLLWTPGRIAYLPAITPRKLPTKADAAEFLAQGFTTLIGRLSLDDESEIDALAVLDGRTPLPINVGFVASCQDIGTPSAADRLVRAISLGVLGLVAIEGGKLQTILDSFKLPLLDESDLPRPDKMPGSLTDLAEQIFQTAKLLGLGSRDSIKLGTPADLLAFTNTAATPLSPRALQRVMLGGRVVFENGLASSELNGIVLRR
jgi:hypothetical protein